MTDRGLWLQLRAELVLVLALVPEEGELESRPAEPMPSLISTLKTNHHSHWSTRKLLALVAERVLRASIAAEAPQERAVEPAAGEAQVDVMLPKVLADVVQARQRVEVDGKSGRRLAAMRFVTAFARKYRPLPLQVNRTRESSVPIQPDWNMLEEIDFPRLSKLRLEVDVEEPQTVYAFFVLPLLLPPTYSLALSGTFGQVFGYDKTFDRITPKTERPLQILDRVRYNTTTSDDPIIQDVSSTCLKSLHLH